MKRGSLGTTVGGWLLCITSAAVVFWQNSRIAVLWDVSFILENAWRISSGDLPYRDFPLAYAPGTFLIQALVIRLFDATWVHHVAYAALITAVATWLSLRILERILAPSTPRFALFALLLCAPLSFLGICAVYPHPFYDSDACLFLLLALAAILRARAEAHPAWGTLAGALLVVPIFIKQNLGLAAFGLAHGALLLELAADRARASRGWRWIALGSAGALAACLAALQLTVGLGAYFEWTVAFAFARRVPAAAGQLDIYLDWVIWAWVAAIGAGLSAAGRLRQLRAGRWLALTLLLVPVLWILPGAFGAGPDVLFPRRNLLSLWPLLMVCAWPVTVQLIRARGLRFEALLPLWFAGVAHAALLSQGLKGSTYGIWPLWIVGVGAALGALLTVRAADLALPLAAGLGLCTTAAAISYIVPNYRVSYVQQAGPIATAGSPRLKGMRTPGRYLPELDALLAFCDRTIPSEEAIVTLPGEDPFFYALRRRPRFPLVLFESSTLNPYTDAELIGLLRERDIRWVVLKRRLQVIFVPMQLSSLLEVVGRDYRSVYRTELFEVFRRVD